MRPKKGKLPPQRVTQKDPKDSILLGNIKASQILDADAIVKFLNNSKLVF